METETGRALPNGPSNDLVADLSRAIRSQQRVVAEEQGVLRSLYKKAKSEGLNLDALKPAIRATKRDPDEVIINKRDELHYMSVLRINMTAEDLFGSWSPDVSQATRHEDDSWDAEDNGYQAGRNGSPLEDCPYPPGSPLADAYTRSWQKGQAAIAREMGEDVRPARKTRGRPARAKEEAPLQLAGPAIAKRKRGRGANGDASTVAH